MCPPRLSEYCCFPCSTILCTYPLAAIPVYPLQASEQTVDPFSTCFSILGCRSSASTPDTNSAHTFPFLHKIPKAGCLVVPRPFFDFLACFLTFSGLFFHLPPRYVSSTSTMPENVSEISLVIAIRIRVNVFKSLYLETLTLSRMIFVECSSRNSEIISFSIFVEMLRGLFLGVESFLHNLHFNLPSVKLQKFFPEHFGHLNFMR